MKWHWHWLNNQIAIVDARTTDFDAATAPANGFNQYDYRHLTSGRIEMRDGDVGGLYFTHLPE